jgi:hypothetical protein
MESITIDWCKLSSHSLARDQCYDFGNICQKNWTKDLNYSRLCEEKIMIIMVSKKNSKFVLRIVQKSAKNSDHNIGPWCTLDFCS